MQLEFFSTFFAESPCACEDSQDSLHREFLFLWNSTFGRINSLLRRAPSLFSWNYLFRLLRAKNTQPNCFVLEATQKRQTITDGGSLKKVYSRPSSVSLIQWEKKEKTASRSVLLNLSPVYAARGRVGALWASSAVKNWEFFVENMRIDFRSCDSKAS